MEDEILFPEIALFKEIQHKPIAKISKNKKRRQIRKAKLRLLKMEGAGMIGVPSFLPPPPLIANEVDANPDRTPLLAGDNIKVACLPAHSFQDDHRKKMNQPATSSDSDQGRYNLRPRVGGLISTIGL